MALNLKNSHHFFLMILPNVFNPHKLRDNLRNPVHEWLHTKHRQYETEEKGGRYRVEHYLFNKLVTIDLIEEDRSINGYSSLFRKLFNREFYYGHCQFFPKTFRLISRKYIASKNEI